MGQQNCYLQTFETSGVGMEENASVKDINRGWVHGYFYTSINFAKF